MDQPHSENTTGAAVTQQRKKQDIDVFKALALIPRPRGQKYNVYCYILSKEIREGFHGMQIFLGSFQKKEEALERVNHIIKTTGVRSIYVCDGWAPIDETFQPDRTTFIPDNKVVQEVEAYQKQLDEQESARNQELEEEILEESKRRNDPTTVENYSYNWSVLIKNQSIIDFYRRKIAELEEASKKRVENIRLQVSSQPQLLDDEWLKKREEVMKKRGEETAFKALEIGYNLFKKEVLPVSEKVTFSNSASKKEE